MKKITYILVLFLIAFTFNNCSEEVDGTADLNFISFERGPVDFGVELGGSSEKEIKVYTTQITGADRTFNINVNADMSTADPAAYTVPSSVTVPANSNEGSFMINMSDLNISGDGETLVLELEAAEENIYMGEPIALNIRQTCPFNEVILSITFDDYPEETTWELVDQDGNILYSGGPYGGESSFGRALCLQDGTYIFTIKDAYGDGIAPPGNYTLSYNGNTIASGDEFGSEDSTTITVP